MLLVVVIGGALGGGDSGNAGGQKQHGKAAKQAAPKRSKVPATYTVESGDTLISISAEFGVPVARIVELNPEVDPQILIAGEELKLR